ncbi:unnamed protein product [Echinostoma caproni]|uniref:Uncharacterized protein n=1 Tax=Echinostoma caproni TaxID=27848 RepID=A0A3P8HJU6_9TREM|nr:unnamed protein product [Echinostoma caproni]
MNRLFSSPTPKPTLEEATALIVAVTIRWLISQKIILGFPFNCKGPQPSQNIKSIVSEGINLNTYLKDHGHLTKQQISPKRKSISVSRPDTGLQLRTTNLNKESLLNFMPKKSHHTLDNNNKPNILTSIEPIRPGQQCLIGKGMNPVAQNITATFPHTVGSIKPSSIEEQSDTIAGELKDLKLGTRNALIRPFDKNPYYSNSLIKKAIDLQPTKLDQVTTINKLDCWPVRFPDQTGRCFTPNFVPISTNVSTDLTTSAIPSLIRTRLDDTPPMQSDPPVSMTSAAYNSLLINSTDVTEELGSAKPIRYSEADKSVYEKMDGCMNTNNFPNEIVTSGEAFSVAPVNRGESVSTSLTNLVSSYKNHFTPTRSNGVGIDMSCAVEVKKNLTRLFQFHLPGMTGAAESMTSVITDSGHVNHMPKMVDKSDYSLY